jgi:hypothetical protein
VIGIDCIVICKSFFHTIKASTAPSTTRQNILHTEHLSKNKHAMNFLSNSFQRPVFYAVLLFKKAVTASLSLFIHSILRPMVSNDCLMVLSAAGAGCSAKNCYK